MAQKSTTAVRKSSQKKPNAAATAQRLTAKTPRKRKPPVYRSFRLHKRIKPNQPKLPTAYRLLRSTLGLLKKNWRLFGVLAIIYGILTVLLVRGLNGGLNLGDLKDSFTGIFKGQFAGIATAAVLFSSLLGSAGSSNAQDGNAYQAILMLIICLVTIWSLRQVLAGKKIRARDGFYKGTYPLVQFTLVLMVIGLQLIPLAIGSWLYSTVVGNGIATNFLEKSLWGLLFFLLSLLSLYMITSSVFALYIVTLPDMTPRRALRSARQLVLHRRWVVMRKVLFLPFALLLLSAIIMIPLLVYATTVAETVFFILTMFGWIITIAYVYNLYRELLHE